ncbi:Uncharacterized protein DAT39_022348, partial [Clarias magur]
CRAGVTYTRETGGGEEEDESGDHGAEGEAEGLQRKHKFPEGGDPQTGGGGPAEGALTHTRTHTPLPA